MNRFSKIIQLYKTALETGVVQRLSKIENWTPDLIHVHVSRLAIGYIIGFVTGSILVAYFK